MANPLANRTYRRLFGAQVVALIGTGLATVALSLLAYDLVGGNAGVILGTAFALKMVAYVAIAPLAGAFAHLLPRKRLLVAMDIVRAGIVLGLPFVTEVWQIYLMIFLLNACSAVFTPLFQATIPDVLRDEAAYTRGLSLSRLAYDLENLLSPTAAALALLLFSYDGLFVMNAVAFAISAGLVLSAAIPSARQPERTGGVLSTVGFGLRIYVRTPRLRGLFSLSFAVAAAGAMTIVNTVVLVRDRFGASDPETALAFAAVGAGSMIVALLLPRWLDRHADRSAMIAGGILLAIGLGLGVFASDLAWLLPVWFAIGVGSSLIQTPAGRLLRRSSTEGDRSAVYSAQFAMSHLCWLVCYPLAGWAGVALGLEATFVILALLALAAVVVAILVWPASDPVVMPHSHGAIVHEHLHVHDAHHDHEHEGWEGPEPHRHPHRHAPKRHAHAYAIDLHHPVWPTR